MASVNQHNPLQGFHIYTDKKFRTIYYNPILKKAMIVPKPDFKRFRMFQSRFITVLAVFLLCFLLFHDWLHLGIWPAIVIGLVSLAAFEYFWYKFLGTLPVYPKFDKNKLKSSYDVTITTAQKKKVWLRVVLMVIIGILLVINGYQLHYSAGLMAACYAAMVLLILYAGFQLWQLSKAAIKP